MSSIKVALPARSIQTEDKLVKTIDTLFRLRSVSAEQVKFVFNKPVNVLCDEFQYINAEDNRFIRLIKCSPVLYAKIRDGVNGCFQVLEIGTTH